MDHYQDVVNYVERIVSALKRDSCEEITKALSQNVDWSDGWEKVSAQLCYNAFEAATAISIGVVLSVLFDQGVVDIPESSPAYLKLLDFRHDPPE